MVCNSLIPDSVFQTNTLDSILAKDNDPTWAFSILNDKSLASPQDFLSENSIILQIYPGSLDFLSFTKIARISSLPALFVLSKTNDKNPAPATNNSNTRPFSVLESFVKADLGDQTQTAAQKIKSLLLTHNANNDNDINITNSDTTNLANSTNTTEYTNDTRHPSNYTNRSRVHDSYTFVPPPPIEEPYSSSPNQRATTTPRPQSRNNEVSSSPTNHSNLVDNTNPLTAKSNQPASKNNKKPNPDSKKPRATDKDLIKQQESAKRYQEALKKKRKEEIGERQRILSLLETDRKERLARAQFNVHSDAEKKRNPIDSESLEKPEAIDTEKGSGSLNQNTSTQQGLVKPDRQNKYCSLLVRNLDGSPLKYKFEATDKLINVRAWVDEQLGNPGLVTTMSNPGKDELEKLQLPYNFVNPLQRLTYGPLEEFNSTLAELGLAPSATLVIKPVTNGSVASAYGGTGSGVLGGEGGLGSAVGAVPMNAYGLVEKGVKGLFGAVSTFLGIGYVPPRVLEKQRQEEEERIKWKEEQQKSYYAGNSSMKRDDNVNGGGSKDDGGAGLDKHKHKNQSDTEDEDNHDLKKRGPSGKGFPCTSSVLASGVSTRYSSVTSFHDMINSHLAPSDDSHPDAHHGTDENGYNGLGKLSSAATSSSNIRTIHGSDSLNSEANTGTKRKGDDQDARITYNGNNLGLEDFKKDENEEK